MSAVPPATTHLSASRWLGSSAKVCLLFHTCVQMYMPGHTCTNTQLPVSPMVSLTAVNVIVLRSVNQSNLILLFPVLVPLTVMLMEIVAPMWYTYRTV